jgi:glucosamine--fructose-6-phosphate aminotransferase (isomerizing)
MCGIVGCAADEPVAKMLLSGLKRVEYRGYDSAGMASVYERRIEVRKGVGKVDEIERRLALSAMKGNTAVAHTRWATHGGVTESNAHPHTSCGERVAIVHNGIVENYLKLKEELLSRGHRFKSETDTEVIAHLLEEEYSRLGDSVKAMVSVVKMLKGQYAVAAIFQDRPDTIVGARKDAPLLVGVSDGKNFIASDVLAFIEHTDRAIFLNNMEVAEVTKDSVRIFDFRGREVKRKPTQVAWELADLSKFDYAHYTLKEINEQPKTVAGAHMQDEARLEEFAGALGKADYVFVVGSGTSYHAGMIFANRLAKEARVRNEAVISGEFRERLDFVDRSTVVVALSQSGETADVLEAVRLARKKGARVLSIVNAVGSTLARESDTTLLLNCGPEVGVAATKSFTAQVVVSNLVVDRLLGRSGNGIESLSSAVERALRTDDLVRQLAVRYRDAPDFYFVARGQHYPVALEGALKLKELSYIHAEGMPASELKHGTLALIEKGTPVVVINPSGPNHEDTLSNAEELRARGADVIGVSDVQSRVYTHFVKVPEVEEKYKPVVEVIPLQLLAYWSAVARRNDPDYPRNLAKSVTVK